MLLEQDPLCTSPNEEFGLLVNNAPLTGYEPNFDDNHFSETTEIFLQESSSDTSPSYLNDTEISVDNTVRALSLHHCSLRSEKNQRAVDNLITLMKKVFLSSQSLSVGHVRTGRPVSDEFGSLISNVRENPRHSSENEQIRILLERQREQILADCRAEIQKHEFRANYDRRSIQQFDIRRSVVE